MEMNLKFTNEQLAILNEALIQLPFKIAAPLIQQINRQIQEAHNKAVDQREESDPSARVQVLESSITPLVS
jgi:hypothetical protein